MLEALDAEAVRRWYEWGLAALDATRDEINSLNVFPVPDADTGTNLHLTLESALQADADEPTPLAPAFAADVAATATTMARRSLLGARGSSGVILSQLLRGVAEVLGDERRPPRGLSLTRALERAVALAYAAVSHPVEGTMLTVARAAAEAARATGSDDLRVVVETAVEAAHRALDETPRQLDVLARAGVVDAGGRGVVVLLDVLRAVVEEGPLPVPERSIARPHLDALDLETDPAPAYEVMYLIDADDDRVPGLRAALDRIGDSVVVSGGGGLWNVHVHTDDAGAAVDAGNSIGHPHRIRITAITFEGAATVHGEARFPGAAPSHHEVPPGARGGRAAGAVAVVLASGSPSMMLREVFARAGARVIDTSDVVVDELAALGARDVAVLVESVAEAMTVANCAEAAAASRGFHVDVVGSAVQLLAAVAVHDAHRPFADDVVAMAGAAAAVRCGEVGVDRMAGGRLLGTVDGADPVAGDDPCDLAAEIIDRMLTDEAELVTVVCAPALAHRIVQRVREAHTGVEIATVPADLGRCVWLGVE